MFNVVSVMLSVFAMSLPVIDSSTIVALLTEFALGVDDTFVNCDPSLPYEPCRRPCRSRSVVAFWRRCPMPTLPDVIIRSVVNDMLVAVLSIANVDAVTEPVAVIVVAVAEPALSTLKLPALTVKNLYLTSYPSC